VDGEHDEGIKREHTDYIAATIPGALVVILPNVSHFAFLQDPITFNNAILRFPRRAAAITVQVLPICSASGGVAHPQAEGQRRCASHKSASLVPLRSLLLLRAIHHKAAGWTEVGYVLLKADGYAVWVGYERGAKPEHVWRANSPRLFRSLLLCRRRQPRGDGP
jgi:hypothetical protein